MQYNFFSRTATAALPEILGTLLSAPTVDSRGGKVKELTHVGITLQNPRHREILVNHRNPSIAAQIAETMWVLQGRSDVEFLSRYLPRAKDFSDDGENWRAAYGQRIRFWKGRDGSRVDQLKYVVDTLRKDPNSRQAVISIWDPAIDTTPGKDIPCNDLLNFSIRDGRLDLHVFVRSNDIIWGWSGINAFEWSTLQEVVATIIGVEVGHLHFSTTSLHIYERHWERAEKMVEDSSDTTLIPKSLISMDRAGIQSVEDLDDALAYWFQVEELVRENPLAPDTISAIRQIKDPLFRSWMGILQWWWSGDTAPLMPLAGTRLGLAAKQFSIQPKREEKSSAPKFLQTQEFRAPSPSLFIKFAQDLHTEKHNAYGNSWKKRGESIGILANIARKVDRLGGGETSDETKLDTAIDLMVYLAKYRTWMVDQLNPGLTTGSDHPEVANQYLLNLEHDFGKSEYAPVEYSEDFMVRHLNGLFDKLQEFAGRDQSREKFRLVERMAFGAYFMARHLWESSQGGEYLGADHE